VITVWVLAAMLAAFLVGSALQRTAGLGLALVAAPILSLLLGPVAGVSVGNVGTTISSALVLVQVWRDVDWRRFARIGPLIVCGAVPGALLVRAVQVAWLDVIVGGLVLLALAASYRMRNGISVVGPIPAMLAGLAGGFMNASAGVAGPAMAVYGIASRWEQRSFTATLQPIFFTAGLSSFSLKSLFGATDPGHLVPWWVWPSIAAAIATGVLIGGRLAPRIGASRARALTIAIAVIGSAGTLTRGLIAL